MMAAELRPELYKWQRITSKTTHRKQQQVKPQTVTDDIEQWIKKVEQASDFAAAQAFGKARTDKSTKASILQTVDQLHDHDAAYDEAQELLNDWVQGQLHVLDDHTTEAQIWSDDEEVTDNFEPSIKNIIQETDAGAISMEEYDRLMNLDNYNEDLATENILEELRRKEVVRPEFLYDLGDIGGQPTAPKPKKDPSMKMRIRQTQVRENKERRRLEVRKRQEEEASRKEALNVAKQKAAEERRKAALKAKQEEVEIQKEMARIKKELQEDRRQQLKKQEEERELERRIALVAKAQATINKKKATPRTNDESCVGKDESSGDIERKRRMTKAMEVAEAKHIRHNMKLMRRCFNRWFDVVLERRLQLGKARAVSDWKCLFRAWNSWRHYTRQCTLDRLKAQHESSMLEDHRKLHQSSVHYERKVLRKFWLQWQLWLAQERQAKQLAQDQNTVRQKMSAFLAAGKQMALEKEILPPTNQLPDQSRVDELFEKLPNRRASHKSHGAKSKRLPTEAWQVTRKHLKLTSGEIGDITDCPRAKSPEVDAFEEATSDAPSSAQVRAPVPKSFQNRFNAQQKILQEQQKALKEQKKMIEDLKFKQDRSLMEEQIKQQQVIQQQLEKLTKLTLEDKKLNAAVPHTPEERGDNCEEPQTCRSQTSSASKISTMSNAFSKRMQERAEERAKAKQERETRRRKQEEERVAEMVAKEEELRQQEAEERKQRVEAYKEKKRLEKLRELEQQQVKEKALANQKKADEHSKWRTVKFYGFRQLRKHCEKMKYLSAEAKKKYSRSLLSQSFDLWRLRYEANEDLRRQQADDLYHRHLVMRCFTNWTQWKLQSQILATKADRHYQGKKLTEVFRAWLDITTREKIEMWEKERQARQHDLRRCKRWVLNTWKRLPEEKRQEEERERRREEMRKKVASLLPDFKT